MLLHSLMLTLNLKTFFFGAISRFFLVVFGSVVEVLTNFWTEDFTKIGPPFSPKVMTYPE